MLARTLNGSRMVRGRGRTPNPYIWAFKKVEEYGKYVKYFDERGQPSHYIDKMDQHKQIVAFDFGGMPRQDKKSPQIYGSAWIAPTATLTGRVLVGHEASIWHGVVIKGDHTYARIGSWTNIQDDTVIAEYLKEASPNNNGSVIIGNYVTIGHGCNITAATVEDFCLVGSKSTLCPDSTMETRSQLGAGSVLHSGQTVPTGQLWAGNPARYIRDLSDVEMIALKTSADNYVRITQQYKNEYYLPSTLYRDLEEEHIL